MKKSGNYFLFIVLPLCMAVLIIQKSVAQQPVTESRYSFVFQNMSIDTVLDQISKKCNVGFSYNPETISDVGTVTATFSKEKFVVILDSIFHTRGILYNIIGRNVALAKIQKSKPPDLENKLLIKSAPSFLQCSGKLIDAVSGKPVSFANVYIKCTSIGTITNLEGDFIIKINPEKSIDSLSFSCLGYKTISKKSELLVDGKVLVKMEPVSVLIPEIVINYTDPYKLLSLALEKIKANYSPSPSLYTAFYRETIRQNKDYVILSEAILKIYKAAYNSYLNDQVTIFKSRKSPFVKPMDTLTFKFQGGIYTSLLLDIAKNQSTFFSDDFLKYYNFKLDEITSIEDRAAFVISFDQKDDAPYALYKGKIYIDRKSLAIVRAAFEISPKGIDRAADELVRKSPRKIKVKPVMAKYMVNYIPRKNFWYLSNIREEVIFRVHKRHSLSNTFYHSVAELVITNTDSTDVHRFKNNETIRPTDIFVEKIGRYDDSFWGDYNFIKPEESIEEALQRVEKKLKTLN